MGGGRAGTGNWKKLKKIATFYNILLNRKRTQMCKALWKGAGTGSTKYKFRPLISAPPPPPPPPQLHHCATVMTVMNTTL